MHKNSRIRAFLIVKISILAPDLSDNCLGRAHLLSEVLQRRYDVEIIGPIFGKGIWQPIDETNNITYKHVQIEGSVRSNQQLLKLMNQIDGDVIYASKPLFTSYGISLLKKIFNKKPVILDIDDWEVGFLHDYNKLLSFSKFCISILQSTVFPYSMGSYWNRIICEELIRFADDITVSGSFLREQFGGTIIRHGRDTDVFNPDNFDKELLREKYCINKNKKIVMFLGTPRLHKGIEDLMHAIGKIFDEDVLLFVVGMGNDCYSKAVIKMGHELLGNRFRPFGVQPFGKIPEFLSISDIIVIPQKNNYATRGQVPAKIFDAMAMAKPIVATAVSDIPMILEGCGWIIDPEDPAQMAIVIKYIFDNPIEAEKAGINARQKCIQKYSYTAIGKDLETVFKKYE